MVFDPNPLLALYATRLLEGGLMSETLDDGLLALAIAAAGLPATTTLAELQGMNLPDPDDDQGGIASEARDACHELLLPGASGIAARIADSEHAREIDRCIRGLIWRDAYDCAISRDRVQLANVPGFDYSEFAEDYEAELAIQARWRATDPAVKTAFETFLSFCSEAVI